MMNKNSRLVLSTDPLLNKQCPRCRNLLVACECNKHDIVEIAKIKAVVRVEKQGRSGKIVTIIAGLPKNEIFLKNLTTTLKKKCGAGGTFRIEQKEGIIEIQGDKRLIIRQLLEQEKINCKT
jgi:translation initiation factor 1